MHPTVRSEILDLPRTLRVALEKGRREFDAVIRLAPWGETPIYFAGLAENHPLAEYMADAFAGLLGWGCVAVPFTEAGFDVSQIRPNTITLAIPGSDPAPYLLLAQEVRSRKGYTLALADVASDAITQSVDGTFTVSRGGELGIVSPRICRQAVAGYLALIAARALKRPTPRYELLEREFSELPHHLNQFISQRAEGVKSLAGELARARDLKILGGGGYYCSAASAADLLARLAGISATPQRIAESTVEDPTSFGKNTLLLVLAGARCRVKKQTLATVAFAKQLGAKVIALTDGNDPDLARHAAMTLLLPPLDEMTGAVLAHAIMAVAAFEASRLTLRSAISSR